MLSHIKAPLREEKREVANHPSAAKMANARRPPASTRGRTAASAPVDQAGERTRRLAVLLARLPYPVSACRSTFSWRKPGINRIFRRISGV